MDSVRGVKAKDGADLILSGSSTLQIITHGIDWNANNRVSIKDVGEKLTNIDFTNIEVIESIAKHGIFLDPVHYHLDKCSSIRGLRGSRRFELQSPTISRSRPTHGG